jgi:hypothetical protein
MPVSEATPFVDSVQIEIAGDRIGRRKASVKKEWQLFQKRFNRQRKAARGRNGRHVTSRRQREALGHAPVLSGALTMRFGLTVYIVSTIVHAAPGKLP